MTSDMFKCKDIVLTLRHECLRNRSAPKVFLERGKWVGGTRHIKKAFTTLWF